MIKFVHLAYIVPTLIAVLQARQGTPSLGEALTGLGMIPAFIDVPPNITCQVFWPFGKLKPGSYLNPEMMTVPPKVTWPIEPKSLYTLFMVGMEEPVIEDEDPYAYTTDSNVPEIRLHEWEQWLVINIPGRNVSAGLQLYEYLTPHPAFKANTSNRYAFFIFKQPYRIIDYLRMDSEGFAFMETISVSKFITDHNLGEPLAANYFLVSWNPNLKVGPRTPRKFISVTWTGRMVSRSYIYRDSHYDYRAQL